MPKIELIPVVELPRADGALNAVGPLPGGSWHTHPRDWERYHSGIATASGYGRLDAFPPGSGLYPIAQFSMSDLNRLVELHLSDVQIEDSCALFGGYVLVESGRPIMVPQCCGTLADTVTWEAIARPEKFEEHFCLEGHPSPVAISDGNVVEIRCFDEYEPFEEPAPKSYRMNRELLCMALNDARSTLAQVSRRLDALNSRKAGVGLSRVLIPRSEAKGC
ncbi:MAG: hypothetical protein ACOY82_04900 [Pseudomonadota bacterium]